MAKAGVMVARRIPVPKVRSSILLLLTATFALLRLTPDRTVEIESKALNENRLKTNQKQMYHVAR